MRSLGRRPWFWVALQALVVFGGLHALGRFEPHIEVDTATYRTMPFDSLGAALSHIRTVGYPLFLRAVEEGTGTEKAAPYGHFFAQALAAIVFCRALQSAGLSPGASGAAASALLYSHAVFTFTAPIVPDSLAVAAAIVSMAALISAAGPSASWMHWTGLALAVFAAIQLRPAYLFLLPLVPCLGVWLAALVFRTRSGWRQGLGLFAGLTIAALAPLILFSGLRWQVTGHFGLVSFGGYNLIGIAGQFLDEELVQELSPKSRPLGRRVLKLRNAQADWRNPDDYWAMEAMYNPMVWTVAVPAAEEMYGANPVHVNQAVGRLAREIILRRRWLYLRWLVWSGREGLVSLLHLFITDRATRLCLLLLLALEVIVLSRRWRRNSLPAIPTSSDQRFLEVHTLLWLALSFAFAKLLLVVLVEVPNHRYLSGAVVFAPTLLAAICWHRWRQIFPPKPIPSKPSAAQAISISP